MSVPVYTQNKKGGDLLILEGYEYLREGGYANRWRCRRYRNGKICRATLDMDEIEKVATLRVEHTHGPEVFNAQLEPAVHTHRFPSPAPLLNMVSLRELPAKASSAREAPPKQSGRLKGQTRQSADSQEEEHLEPEPTGSAVGDTPLNMQRITKKRTTNAFGLGTKRTVSAASVQDKTMNGFTGSAQKKTKRTPHHRAPVESLLFPSALRLPNLIGLPAAAPTFPADAIPLPKGSPKGNKGVAGNTGTDDAETFGQYITAMLKALRPEHMRHYVKTIRKTIIQLDQQVADQDSDAEMN